MRCDECLARICTGRARRLRAQPSDGDLTRFRAWAADAHRWFAWTDPEDGIAREVRVRGGAGAIQYRARVRGGRRSWELSCELEGYIDRIIATGA